VFVQTIERMIDFVGFFVVIVAQKLHTAALNVKIMGGSSIAHIFVLQLIILLSVICKIVHFIFGSDILYILYDKMFF